MFNTLLIIVLGLIVVELKKLNTLIEKYLRRKGGLF